LRKNQQMGDLTPALVGAFREIIGAAYVVTDGDLLQPYSHDETEELFFMPHVVLKPRTAAEISGVMRLCNEHRIPVTPRGAGTGLSGGALPHLGGVLISMERMNAIVGIDERNGQVVTEPGVITEVLQDAVRERGLFYPPDPSSPGVLFYRWKYC
jgi:glycolate oxidase